MTIFRLSVRKDDGGLGFHNLQVLNLAMLEKQYWRFLSNSDTLVSKIFKSKYYPINGDFLHADLGHIPSYWCNNRCSQVIVEGGYRWKDGNRNLINVWNDSWLQQSSGLKIQRVMSSHLQDIKVCELF